MLSRLLSCLLLFATTTVTAQQYGHLNFANVLAELSETKAAEEQLKSYNDSLVTVGEELVAKLTADAEKLEASRGDLPPVQYENQVTALRARRDEIAQFEQEVSYLLEQRRQRLLGPLVQRVRDAIDEVGDEGNYLLIFDTSMFNAVLFADETKDITDKVKAKLADQ